MTWRQWVGLIVATVVLSALWVGVSIWGGGKVDRYLEGELNGFGVGVNDVTVTVTVSISTLPTSPTTPLTF